MEESGDGSPAPPALGDSEYLFNHHESHRLSAASINFPDEHWDFDLGGIADDHAAAHLGEVSADLDSWGSHNNSNESVVDLLSWVDESSPSNESTNSEHSTSPSHSTKCSNTNFRDDDCRQVYHPSPVDMLGNSLNDSLAPQVLSHMSYRAVDAQYLSCATPGNVLLQAQSTLLMYREAEGQHLSYARPGIAPLQVQSAGTKRVCHPDLFKHIDTPLESQLMPDSTPRRKSARTLYTSLKRENAILPETIAVATAAAAAIAAADAAAVASSATFWPPLIPGACFLEQAGVRRASADRLRQHPCKSTILQCCKFTSKQTHQTCRGYMRVVTHKRGYLTVSCSSKHQWVWCSLCCNCYDGKGLSQGFQHRGCDVPIHWFERDAFDTGARNHMNLHKV